MTRRALVLFIAAAMVAAACGGGDAAVGDSGSSVATTTTTTEAAPQGIGSAEAFLTEALQSEGFTEEESACLSAAVVAEYGEDGLREAIFSEEEPEGFHDVLGAATLDCVSAERLFDRDDGPPADEAGDAATSVDAEAWAPKTIDQLIDAEVIVNDGFGWQLPAGWYEQVWFKPAESGELWWEDEGAMHLTGGDSNSRAGVRLDLDLPVGDYTHAVVAIHGIVYDQTLPGTGFDGREAPLALGVAYLDAEGTAHVGLSEDPASPTNVFYRGFSILDATDERTAMTNGVMVTPGEPFIHQFDLMALDPKPVEILFLIAEGGGWPTRDAVLAEMALVLGY